ncbi:hypothetical protein DsansV1_C14g0129851 [Dioscorea sansibarensis]
MVLPSPVSRKLAFIVGSDFPSLRELEVENCSMLKFVEKLDSLEGLKLIGKRNKKLRGTHLFPLTVGEAS